MKFEVDETVMTYLESLYFDVIGLKEILKEIAINLNNNEYNKESYEFFSNDFKETNRKYHFLKTQIINEFVPNEHHRGNFEFDFLNSEVKIVEQGGCKCDACE